MSGETSNDLQSRRAFVVRALLKGLVALAFIIGAFVLGKQFGGEQLAEWLAPLTDRPLLMYAIFLLSETFIGLIPPEFYMIWALSGTCSQYIWRVTLLAALSYIGGLTAFFMGKWLNDTRLVRRWLAGKKAQKYQRYFQQYGWTLIVIAAVTPLPFALISSLAGSLNYRFTRYLSAAAPRILRFAVYGWIIWQANGLA